MTFFSIDVVMWQGSINGQLWGGKRGWLPYNMTYHVSIKENFLGYFGHRVLSPILATERMAAE